MTRYEDIIDFPHHVSDCHARMSMLDRAAQFSPFAALTGYDAAIEETARLTDTYISTTGKVKKVDAITGLIVVENKLRILIEDIVEVYFQSDY